MSVKKTIEHYIMLDDKINQFLNWYTENVIKGNRTNIGEYFEPMKMKYLIEKMAVWYELRYPNYEINNLMLESCCDQTRINDVMFKRNQYFNGLIGEKSEYLKWDEFYNANVFINSLPWEEKSLFVKFKYPEIIYLKPDDMDVCLCVSKNDGIVTEAKFLDLFTQDIIKNKELEGLNVRQVAKLLDERGIILPSNNGLSKVIDNADKWKYLKEEMLNCVMYQIIERGGNRIGPRRAFLFAREFKRNIDIPMIYGVDRFDPFLESFINMYLDAGGSKQLSCLIGYFNRTSDHANFDTITIDELIKQNSFKTTAELKEQKLIKEKQTELLQKLAITLYNQIDQSELEKELAEMGKEKVKQLRLERKLEKSRKN